MLGPGTFSVLEGRLNLEAKFIFGSPFCRVFSLEKLVSHTVGLMKERSA